MAKEIGLKDLHKKLLSAIKTGNLAYLDTHKKLIEQYYVEIEKLRCVKIKHVEMAVLEVYKITKSQLNLKSRKRSIVEPRQVAQCVARELTGDKLFDIASYFNQKNHASVLHSYNTVINDMKINIKLRNNVELVMKKSKKYADREK